MRQIRVKQGDHRSRKANRQLKTGIDLQAASQVVKVYQKAALVEASATATKATGFLNQKKS